MNKLLLKWYKDNKRDLPWRKTKEPYKIWVSEIILQQTQIKTGLNYYNKFIHEFPTVKKLAKAETERVLKIWEGLGYYNRALNMLESAKLVVKKYNGIFPKEYDELIKLKGVGPYTAAAISSFCNKEKKAVVDGNVYRVLSRLYNVETNINTTTGKKEFQQIANKLISQNHPGEYNQAIMDFGSTHCTKYHPKCKNCPFQRKCISFKLGNVHLRPVKIAKKISKIRYFNYLFITNKLAFLIQQRSGLDIWKKLYELPLIETDKKIDKLGLINQKKLKYLEIINIKKNYDQEHHLSHQKLKITFWEINVKSLNINDNIKKIKQEHINKYPFPKPLEKYLKIQFTNAKK